MERSRIPSLALLLGVTLSLAGCGGSDGLLAGPPPAGSPGEVSQARLDRVAGCSDLLEFLRQDGQVKVRDQADGLRQNGWRGSGFVRWQHPSNRGFLRALAGLQRCAEAIGERDEAERCQLFLLQLDPGWPPDELR